MNFLKENAALVFLFIVGNILLMPFIRDIEFLNKVYFKPDGFYDSFFALLWIITIFYYVNKILFAKKKGYITSPYYALISVLIGLAYLFQRFYIDYFFFYGFSHLSFIAYLDFIIIGTVSNIVLFILSKSQEGIEKPSFFYTDDPNETIENSKFEGRVKAANELAKRITQTYSKRAFAIAIEGEWGTGKTVFLKQIYEALKKGNQTDQILIEFNPWDGNMPNSIIENFFGVLSQELGQYSTQLSWQINRYMDNLISSNDNTIVNGILHFFKSFFGSSALSTQFEHINTTLKKLDKQLIIFIDDTDRLDKDEIYQVIKLIRNTANFYNTIFIAAFDRPYVVEALKEFNEHNHDLFLEKIFQLEIQLPEYDARIIREELKKILLDKIGGIFNEYKSKIETIFQNDSDPYFNLILGKSGEIVSSQSNLRVNILDNYIVTLRDVKRYVNNIILGLPAIAGNICIRDYFIIELIKLKYSQICKILYNNSEDFLSKNDKKEYCFNMNLSGIDPIKEIVKLTSYSQEKDERNIRAALLTLFESSVFSDHEKSIRRPSNFHKYFSYSLFDGDFPHHEFDGHRQNSTEDDFLEHLLKWKEIGLTDKIFQKMEDMKHFDNDEDVEKVLSVFFRFCDKIQLDTSFSLSFERLVNYIHQTSESNYNKSLVDFLISLFDKATFPYLFANNTLSSIEWINNTVKNELYLKYFEEHLKNGDNFHEIIRFYYAILKLDQTQKDLLKQQLFNFIKTKGLKTFFENNRRIDHHNNTTCVFMGKNNFIIEFFETQENYEAFLEKLPDDPFIKEYRSYYELSKANSFQPISFPFKELRNPFN